MTLPTDPLELSIFLSEKLENFTANDDRTAVGLLPDDLDIDDVLGALDATDIRGPGCDAADGRVVFNFPTTYFSTMEEFLRNPRRRVEVPRNFYVAEYETLYPRDRANLPDTLSAYIETVSLFDALAKIADDKRKLGDDISLIFLDRHKLVLTPEYGADDLVELTRLGHFTAEFVESDIHKSQKATIIRTALFELFMNEKKLPIKRLLSRFSDFLEHVESSYQLYVSEFSFQKVKAEVEREKLEFTTRLNKIFSDIQNQLLAIPVALVLVGGQMKPIGDLALANIVVWLGALVFTFLMIFLINNQRNTLDAINSEINEQWELINTKHQVIASQFQDAYTQLETRYKHQQGLLCTITCLVIVAFLCATGLLVWYSNPASIS